MADLNEETTVQEEQVEETVETKKPIDPNLQGIQLFYEKNKNMVNYVGGGLLVLIAAVCFFKFYYLPEQEAEASNEIFWAETAFERDSFNLALRGGALVMTTEGQKPMMGFEQIAADYSMTKTGNLANYYTGICYLRTGKFEQAIEFLKAYDGKDEMVASIALGAIGDSYMELGKMDDAVNYYLKAANQSHNTFTTPYYLKKAGFVCEQQGDFKEALSAYERIQKEFNSTNEGRAIDKDIAKVKALGNL